MNQQKKKVKFNKEFWEHKYSNDETGWDIGYASTPLTNYFDQLTNKELKILIPGGGNSYEAEYLFEKGFKNVFVIDIALQPLLNLKKRFPDFPENHLIHDNFFNHTIKYDLIVEQTFFCALDPILRENYVTQMYHLLNPNGKLIGLLFDFELTEEGPPFGGNIVEYTKLFYSKFSMDIIERCQNSIKPRQGKELFFIFEKN